MIIENEQVKKIIITLFFGSLLAIPFGAGATGVPVIAKNEVPFVASKGSRFDICKDVAAYINKHRKLYDSDPRELFSVKEGKFNKPKARATTVERYIQIALQNMAYHPIQLTGYRTGWKNRITFMEQRVQQDFSVVELSIDINNDGITERVQSYSYYNSEYKFWGHVNTVLDNKGNINLAFEQERVSTGELFYYDGRTFAYRRHGDVNNIYDHFPSYKYDSTRSKKPKNINGLSQTPAIYELTLRKINNLKD